MSEIENIKVLKHGTLKWTAVETARYQCGL